MTSGQPTRFHTPLLVGDDDAWWKRAVVYQIYPRSFSDSDGDGIGDLRGIIDRLDYLERLGVDAMWLSPIYPSPHADNGYDISDYRDIDPIYGSLADFDTLLADAHRRGIRLIMDLVVNHTSDQHPWFRESAASVDSPRRSWYWWRPPRSTGGGTRPEPTNWESFFSGPTWTLDERTGEYYLHLFTPHQPDLNWEQPDVRHAIYEMMGWWLDRGVDGFRMDVINLISKDPRLPDGLVDAGARYGNGFPHYANGPRLHEYLAEMRRNVFTPRDRTYLSVGEMPGATIEVAQRATAPDRGELDMVFQFEHVECDHPPGNKWTRIESPQARLVDALTRWQEGLAGVGWNSLYLGNHDHPRSLSRFGDVERYWYRSGTALSLALHCLSGTPFIYQGDELGMVNPRFTTLDQLRDVEALNRHRQRVDDGLEPDDAWGEVLVACRDHARAPMHWSSTDTSAFTTGESWIDAPMSEEIDGADIQVDDPTSMFNWYRRLIELRHHEAALVHGRFRRIHAGEPDVFVYTRSLDRVVLLVIANLSDEVRTVDRAELGRHVDEDLELIVSNVDEPTVLADGELAPWESSLWRSAGEHRSLDRLSHHPVGRAESVGDHDDVPSRLESDLAHRQVAQSSADPTTVPPPATTATQA